MEYVKTCFELACFAYVVYSWTRSIAKAQRQAAAWQVADGVRKLREKAEAMDAQPAHPSETNGYRSAALREEKIVKTSWLDRARRQWRAKQEIAMERRLSGGR